jgi:zinc protease
LTPTLEPLGDARRVRFASGLTLVCERAPRLPIVAVAAAIQAGAAEDPRARAGLSTVTVELLRTGTRARDEDALARAFADLGASLRTDRGQDWIDVSSRFLAQDFERGLALLAEVVRRPAFEAAKLERVRKEILAERESSRARAEDMLVEAFYRAVYRGHPYETPFNGLEATLRAISREDVSLFHAKYFVPQSTTLAIVGDVEPERIAAAVADAFGDWAAPAPPGERAAPGAAPAPSAGRRIILVPKPDQSQAHVRIGHPAIPRAHADWDALLVANYILGGAGLASRITDTVRTKNGLAYSAGSFVVPRRLAGPFAATAQTKNESCARAIELMLAETERIRRDPVPEDDLALARDQLSGSLPFRLETVAHKAGALLEAELYGLGPDHMRRQIERVRALAADDVRAAARVHLDPARATIVVVGERDALAPQLGALGEVAIEEALP